MVEEVGAAVTIDELAGVLLLSLLQAEATVLELLDDRNGLVSLPPCAVVSNWMSPYALLSCCWIVADRLSELISLPDLKAYIQLVVDEERSMLPPLHEEQLEPIPCNELKGNFQIHRKVSLHKIFAVITPFEMPDPASRVICAAEL